MNLKQKLLLIQSRQSQLLTPSLVKQTSDMIEAQWAKAVAENHVDQEDVNQALNELETSRRKLGWQSALRG